MTALRRIQSVQQAVNRALNRRERKSAVRTAYECQLPLIFSGCCTSGNRPGVTADAADAAVDDDATEVGEAAAAADAAAFCNCEQF
jgi:hypothetical protein